MNSVNHSSQKMMQNRPIAPKFGVKEDIPGIEAFYLGLDIAKKALKDVPGDDKLRALGELDQYVKQLGNTQNPAESKGSPTQA